MYLKANTKELTSYHRDNNSMTCPNKTAEWYLLYGGHIVFEKHLKTIVQLSTEKQEIP